MLSPIKCAWYAHTIDQLLYCRRSLPHPKIFSYFYLLRCLYSFYDYFFRYYTLNKQDTCLSLIFLHGTQRRLSKKMYSKIFDFIFQNSFSITHKNLFCVPTYSCQILIPTLNFISFQDGNELGTIMSTQGQSYTQSNSQSIRSLVIQSLTDLVVHFLILINFACMPAVTYPSHTSC